MSRAFLQSGLSGFVGAVGSAYCRMCARERGNKAINVMKHLPDGAVAEILPSHDVNPDNRCRPRSLRIITCMTASCWLLCPRKPLDVGARVTYSVRLLANTW